MARNNPLLARPPVVGKHRGGEGWVNDITREFGSLLREVAHESKGDMYWGVHLSCEPFAALAYALNYRQLGYNEWGYEDVEVPAVLLGIDKLPASKLTNLDLDVLGTAKDLLRVAGEFSDAIGEEFPETGPARGHEDWSEIEEWAAEHEGFRDIAADHGRSEYWDVDMALEDMSLGFVAGDFANRPNHDAFFSAAMSLVRWESETGDHLDSDHAKEVAVEMAGKLVPQRRYLGDIGWDYLRGFIIVPGFGGVRDDDRKDSRQHLMHILERGEFDPLEGTVELSDFRDPEHCSPLDPRDVFQSFEEVSHASGDLLELAFKLGCVYDRTGERVEDEKLWKVLKKRFQWWHGTNLDRAVSAFPGAFPRSKHDQFVFDGSYRCNPDFDDDDDDW